MIDLTQHFLVILPLAAGYLFVEVATWATITIINKLQD